MRNANLFKLALVALTLAMLATVLAFTSYGAHPTPADEWQWLKLKTEVVVPPVTPPPVVKQPAPVVPKVLAPRVVKPAAKPVAKPAPKLAIPSPRSKWTHPGNTKAALISHLLTHSAHRKWTRAQLEPLSYSELERLHSADHEGRTATVRVSAPVQSSGCPGGRCPVGPQRSGGIFGGLFRR